MTERLLGAAGIAHQKKKRESCHSTDEKVQTFFSFFKRRSFRANSLDLFVLLLLLFNAGGGGTALLVWNDIIFSISFTCARELTPPFYTAAAAVNAPAPRRPLSLWIVHGERFFIWKKWYLCKVIEVYYNYHFLYPSNARASWVGRLKPPFYTAAIAIAAAVHSHYGLCTVNDFLLKK